MLKGGKDKVSERIVEAAADSESESPTLKPSPAAIIIMVMMSARRRKSAGRRVTVARYYPSAERPCPYRFSDI